MSGDELESEAHRPWNNSWPGFAAELQRLIDEGASDGDLGHRFGGNEVTWEGRIEKIDIDELSAIVDIGLKEVSISFPDGGVTRIDGISLPIADDSEDQWRQLPTDSEISFKAAFLPERSVPFPPIPVRSR